MIEIAVWTAVVICGLMVVFQILLALGAPWGKMAWGGKHRVLPLKFRIGSLVSAAIFILAAITVLEKAGLYATFHSPTLVNILMWFFVGLFALSTLANITSKSLIEKTIMTPVAISLTVLCLMVAIGL